MGGIQPSKLQLAIYQAVKQLRFSIRIIAVAGSGKTTTIVDALKLLPQGLRVAFVAFNKKIVDELKQRVPKHVFVMTLHSMGFSALRRAGGQPQKFEIDEKKCSKILSAITASMDYEDAESYRGLTDAILKLVALAKAHGIVPGRPRSIAPEFLADNHIDWTYLIDHFEIDANDSMTAVVLLARQVLAKSNADRRILDFNDMLYQAIIYNAPFWKYNVVFVDESQDLSVIQHVMLQRSLKPGGLVVAVGDPHQAIYGFRGADADSMDKMQAMFKMQDYPLSISYRCAQNIVQYAQIIVPEIEPSPTALEGEVSSWSHYTGQDFEATDLMMCRNTAPLVEMAFTLIRAKVPVQVLGREIGKGLTALINRIDRRTKTTRNVHGDNGLVERLNKWLDKQMAKFLQKDQEDKVQQVRDKYDTIQVFIDDSQAETVGELCEEIEAMFKEDAEEGILTLSTVHKAKGLEAPRAFVLEPDLMPSHYAKRPWQIDQEKNLMYVAYTRAKENLHFIRKQDMHVPRVDAVRVNDGLGGGGRE